MDASAGEQGFDWRDGEAYAPLLGADRSLLAWEWLRRDGRYVEVATKALSARMTTACPEEFGLVGFESPHLAVPRARPIWAAQVHPYVLFAERRGDSGVSDGFDLERFGDVATLAVHHQGERLLLSDGLRTIRLDAPAGTFRHGRVCLRYRLEGIAAAKRPLLTLQRLLALCRSGRFSHLLHPPERRARRWILMLRALDALEAGADQREIARELLSPTAGEPRWRSREPSIRSQAQRLVRSVRLFSAGGYRALLG